MIEDSSCTLMQDWCQLARRLRTHIRHLAAHVVQGAMLSRKKDPACKAVSMGSNLDSRGESNWLMAVNDHHASRPNKATCWRDTSDGLRLTVSSAIRLGSCLQSLCKWFLHLSFARSPACMSPACGPHANTLTCSAVAHKPVTLVHAQL